MPGFPDWVRRDLEFRGVIRSKTLKESVEKLPYNRKIEKITDPAKRAARREIRISGKVTAEEYDAELDLILKNQEKEKKKVA